jgi:pimeloyl-ACP methyl ester carboxylesterase
MVRSASNSLGTPIESFEQIRAAVLADRSQFFKDLTIPFYGYNRKRAKVSEGVRESFWLQGMMAGLPACYFCIKAFSETDMTEDLKKIDVPTLILHGDDDQIAPIRASAMLSAELVKNAELKSYEGGSHGMCDREGQGQPRPARIHQVLTVRTRLVTVEPITVGWVKIDRVPHIFRELPTKANRDSPPKTARLAYDC